MTVQSDCSDDDVPLDALVQKRKNENNNGNNETEQENDKIIPLTGTLIIIMTHRYNTCMTHL